MACALAFLVFASITIVPPAHIGVLVTLGHVHETTLPSGLHLCNPLSHVTIFSTKTSLFEQQNHVPTREGLTVDLDTAVLFRIDQAKVREIYITLGVDFVRVVLEPELASAVRGLTSESEAKALYTSDRAEIQRKLKADLQKTLEPRGILLEDVLLKAVALPRQLIDSIELKAKAEQDAGRMEFVLAKERQEADRKSIEAKGIAEFQRIVSEGISPALLQWKGIEATEKLAESPNSKVVIMGNSKESLPVILGADAADAVSSHSTPAAKPRSGQIAPSLPTSRRSGAVS